VSINLLVGESSVGELSVGESSVDQSSVGESSFGQSSVGQLPWSLVCTIQRDMNFHFSCKQA
jgi:hypothetical protein